MFPRTLHKILKIIIFLVFAIGVFYLNTRTANLLERKKWERSKNRSMQEIPQIMNATIKANTTKYDTNNHRRNGSLQAGLKVT